MPVLDLPTLIREAHAGRRQAFIETLASVQRDLRGICAACLPTEQAVLPVLQAIVVRLRRDLIEDPPPSSGPAWLMAGCTRVLRQHFTEAHERSTYLDDGLVQILAQQGERQLEGLIAGEPSPAVAVERRFASLSPAASSLLCLRYADATQTSRIAVLHQVNRSHIALSLCSARAALDWQGDPQGQMTGQVEDELFASLLEDYLFSTILEDSLELLRDRLNRDARRRLQFERQVRIHLLLIQRFAVLTAAHAQALVQAGEREAAASGTSSRRPSQPPSSHNRASYYRPEPVLRPRHGPRSRSSDRSRALAPTPMPAARRWALQASWLVLLVLSLAGVGIILAHLRHAAPRLDASRSASHGVAPTAPSTDRSPAP